MDVFVTGATGFIGGSVAVRLVEAGHRVRGLARSAEKGEALRGIGVEAVIGSLDDEDTLTAAARESDAVINAADSDHRGAVDTFVEALAGTGKVLLHTSGSSIVGDDSRGEASDRVHTEAEVLGDWEPAPDKAARVAIDRSVLAAADRGVRSAVLCNTLIYGHGRGLARDSVQIPRLVAQAEKSGVVRHVGPGRNIWSNAHVDDVAGLYVKALDGIAPGTFHFVESGEASFLDITGAIADALGLGPPQAWDIDSAIAEWGYEPAVFALGSNSRVRGTAREVLGWRPRHDSVTSWIRGGLAEGR
ncbi:NAD-dependent epimerase/dehydratase family protein [Phytomonospora sp. NPDC050363]|uniref:NAD-dependent epimerase/dehydratase family protein n=1 Tax=Phytomonospora sp. NPDC050363 TaxID=3155642 RepID=UPI0033F9F9EB